MSEKSASKEPVVFPFYGPEFFESPYPLYRQIRDPAGPLYSENENCWLVASHSHAADAFKESRLSKRTPGEKRGALDSTMLFQDPPEHTRLRSLLGDGLSAPKIAGMEHKIEALYSTRLDSLRDGQAVDYIAEFALPLPAMVIGEMLGIAPSPACELASLSNHIFILRDDMGAATQESLKRFEEANEKMTAFFTNHLESVTKSGCPFHFSRLAGRALEGESASAQEKIAAAMLLVVAGAETTKNLLGNGLLLLIQHPEAWRRLRAEPELIDSAIEEMLRFESPVQRGTLLTAVEDFELGSRLIKKGNQVAVLIGAANRDPEVFTDPDRFDITRSPNRHITFGAGPHFCMGTSLARLEARIAFRMILERFSEVRIATPAPESGKKWGNLFGIFSRQKTEAPSYRPAWVRNKTVRGLKNLPVTFVRDRTARKRKTPAAGT